MATSPTPEQRRAEALASIRASQERMLVHREEVLRSIARLREIAESRRRRWFWR
jgi:hypothetical protein